MKKMVTLIGFFFLWSGLACAEIKIRLLDMAGQAVSNAVVSISLPETNTKSSSTIDASSMPPAVMDQVDKQFLPHVLIVKKGQSVVFPNSDQVRHHVYSFSKPNDFEIRLYSGNQADPVSFMHQGIAVLGCNIHDQMLGYLYIEENEIAKVTDENGYVVFDETSFNSSIKNQELMIWHSQLSSNKTDRVGKQLREKDNDGVWHVSLDLLPEVQKSNRKFKPRFQ